MSIETIKDVLDNIVHTYSRSRQVGHTSMAATGVSATDNASMVAFCVSQAKELSDRYQVPVVTVHDLAKGKKFGPLAFDNYAIMQICKTASDRIEELERSEARLTRKIARAMEALQ